MLFVAFTIRYAKLQWADLGIVFNNFSPLLTHVNTLPTGDADLRFYVTTVQDG